MSPASYLTSIIYDGKRSLDLVCPDDASFELWFHGLEEMVQKVRVVCKAGKAKHKRSLTTPKPKLP